MKIPLVDNKHIYYCQIILGDELTFVDNIDDLELVGIHHILRVKYIHNKGNLSQREMYKYCNAFDEKTQKKVDYIYNNILDKKYLNKLIKSIIEKSENAKKSVFKRIKNDSTKDVSNDKTNDSTKDVSNVNDNVNVNVNIKKNIKEKSFIAPTLKEVEDYILEKQLNISGTQFFNFFDVANWIDSKGNKVKNWKQKLLTWANYNNSKVQNNNKKEDGLI